jgi:hypothetical protein
MEQVWSRIGFRLAYASQRARGVSLFLDLQDIAILELIEHKRITGEMVEKGKENAGSISSKTVSLAALIGWALRKALDLSTFPR